MSHLPITEEPRILGAITWLGIKTSSPFSCSFGVFTPIAARYTRINTSLNDSIMNEGDRDE